MDYHLRIVLVLIICTGKCALTQAVMDPFANDPNIQSMRRAIELREPDLDSFIWAMDTIITKHPIRLSSLEFYHISMYWTMRACGIYDVKIKDKYRDVEIDITGQTLSTQLLFQLKYNRNGVSEAWRDADRSKWIFLHGTKNLLVAGIVFSSRMDNMTVLAGWRGELLSPNGTLLRTYRYPKRSKKR